MSKLEKIYKITDKLGTISVAVFSVGLVLGLIYVCLEICGVSLKNWEYVHILRKAFKYLFFGSFILIMVFGLISNWIAKRLGIDEEKAKRKAEIKEAIQEIETEKKTQTKLIRDTEEVECPLIDLNEKQKEEIINLLKRRITTHEKDYSRVNRSVVYTYLSALRALHVITPVKNSDDIDARRRWIEQIAGLFEPPDEWAHFRGDYDENKSNNKVRAAIKEIESEIEKFR